MGKNRIRFLNTHIDNISMCDLLDEINNLISDKGYHYIVTPNIDHLVILEKNCEFRKAYNNADLILTDGMPIMWLSKLFGNPIIEKLSGSDIFPKICDLASQKNYKVFLLGAAEGIAAIAAINLKNKYPGLVITGTYSPQIGFENDEKEINKIIEIIKNTKPDILAVGLGAPKQELFIFKYLNQLKVPLSLAIGASIDFEANNIKRAPKWMQKSGLEWLYRLLKEPRRLFKRYFFDFIYIIRIAFKYYKVKDDV